MRPSSIKTVLTLLCLQLLCKMVSASRDADSKSVEVSAGSHFIEKKEGASLAAVRKHHEEQGPSDPGPTETVAVTPAMRAQVAAFSKLAVQALANGANPDMSHEEKAEHVQAALAQAANAMTSIASLADMKKHPDMAEKLARLKELTAPSLIQKRQNSRARNSASPPHKALTPEMREKVSSFATAAVEAMANRNKPDVKPEDKAKAVHVALIQAANAMSSFSSMADMSKNPKLAERLASLRELAVPSLIEKHQGVSLESSKGHSNATKITPEMRERVVAFSKMAAQAIANAKNPDMSPEEKAKAVQAALANSANVLTSIAMPANKVIKPELAQGLAELRELTAVN